MALQYTYQFEAIGTPWSIDTAAKLSQAQKQAIHQLINEFDANYSRFRTDSLVSQARRNGAGTYTFPDTIKHLYDTYVLLEQATRGAVNPLVGETLEHFGYDAQYSLQAKSMSAVKPPSFAQTITRANNSLTYKRPALLDIGAIGKGYLVDLVADYLAPQYKEYVVEAGGDMRIACHEPYVIGLEDPSSDGQIIGTLSLQNQSICASSPNRRSWGKGLHHIIDATTGKPTASDIVATWAIAPTTLLADALTTALFFVPAAELQKVFGNFEYISMQRNGHVEHNIVT